MRGGVLLAVFLAAFAGYWLGTRGSEPTGSPGISDDVEVSGSGVTDEAASITAAAPSEEESPSSRPDLPESEKRDSILEGRTAPSFAGFAPELPLGCYLSVEEMPEDLRGETTRILGEVPQGKYHLFLFGDRELHTSRINPVPDSPEVYYAVADLVVATSVVKVLRAEFIEGAERRGEATSFETLREAREFSERERNLVVSPSLNDGFVVVDLTDLFTRSDYKNAIEFQEACRSTVLESRLEVTTYGYTR